jgi:hypothetical protein
LTIVITFWPDSGKEIVLAQPPAEFGKLNLILLLGVYKGQQDLTDESVRSLLTEALKQE